jgi:hypothetical protein
LQNRKSWAPLGIIFSVHIHGSWTLGKPYEIKLRCYWEHAWERDGNTLVTRKQFKKSLPSPSIPQKEKSWTVHECMPSFPIHCMKFLFQNCSSPFFAWANTPFLRTAIPICSDFGCKKYLLQGQMQSMSGFTLPVSMWPCKNVFHTHLYHPEHLQEIGFWTWHELTPKSEHGSSS